MTSHDDLTRSELNAIAFGADRHPIDWAIFQVTMLIDARRRVSQNPGRGTGALASWADVSDAAVARKIVGTLLDAGWNPPSPEVIAAARAEERRRKQAYEAWRATVSDADWARWTAHHEKTGEFPPDCKPPA